jgi:hypothetical protein
MANASARDPLNRYIVRPEGPIYDSRFTIIRRRIEECSLLGNKSSLLKNVRFFPDSPHLSPDATVEQRLFSSPSTDFLADAFEGNAFTGFRFGGGRAEPGEQHCFFRSWKAPAPPAIEPRCPRRFFIRWQSNDCFLNLHHCAHTNAWRFIGSKFRDGEGGRHCLHPSRPHADGQVVLLPAIHSYRDAIRDSRIAASTNKLVSTKSRGRANHEWLFRWRFAQSRVAQLGLAPTLAAFASRSVISTPPRFAINYSVRAGLAVFVKTHRLRTSDAERDQEVSRKPSLRCYTGITYSINSASQNKSFAPDHSGIRPGHCAALGAGSELVLLVFEQDVERGQRSVTARDILLQIELVRIA